MEMKMSEIVMALVAYAGPFDDPSIGWTGRDPSHIDLFKCERCGVEGHDTSKMLHADGCSAAMVLDVLARLRLNSDLSASQNHRQED